MTLLRSLGAVAGASDAAAIDWAAVVDAATAATDAGSLEVDPDERSGFAADARAARDAIRQTTGLAFDGPDAVYLQDRHQWIEANVATFRRVLAPLSARPTHLPGLAARVNTAAMATTLSVLGRAVLGQYDPGLAGSDDPRLVYVLPNLREAATTLDVDYPRFRRWIVFHEVTHVAEFEAAPWLAEHLADRIDRVVVALADGQLDRAAIRDVDLVMTAVEGYAEFAMDRAFEPAPDDLREKLDARRRRGGPIATVLRWAVGLGVKRRQYERGRRFFDAVAAARGAEATAAVWARPDALPTAAELDRPARWVDRVDP